MNKKIAQYVLCISLIFSFIGIIKNPLSYNPYIVIVSTVIFYFGMQHSKTKPYIGSTLLTVYYFLVVPLQYALSYIQPESIISANYNKYYDKWMFADNDLMLTYFLYATGFYFIGMLVIGFVEKCSIKDQKGRYQINSEKKIEDIDIVHFPMIWLCASSLADYIIRQNTINGILSFFMYGWSIFNLANVVIKYTKKNMTKKSVFAILISLIIYSLPGILAGRRTYVIGGIFITLIYLFSVSKEQIMEIANKRKASIFVLVVLFFVAFGFANMSKFGVFNPVGLFVSRITGLFDGSSILDYQRHNHVNLGLKNYLLTAYNDSGVRANKYYTKTIIGYPPLAATSSAAPIFISSLLYGNIGFFSCSVFFTGIFGIVSKISNVSYENMKRDKIDIYSKYKSFISADAVYVVFISYFIDGNIEIIKNLFTPLVAWCLFLVLWALKTEREKK